MVVPSAVSKGQIAHVKSGDPVRASEWNQIAKFINNFGSGNSAVRPHFAEVVNGLTPIPVNSIFSMSTTGGSTTPDRPQIPVQQGPGKVLFTNREPIPASGTAHALMVGRFIPVLLNVVVGQVPTFGSDCGPVSGQWGVSSNGEGLIAVSSVDANNQIWCISPGGASGYVNPAIVTVEIPPAPGDGSFVSGGKAKHLVDTAGTQGDEVNVWMKYSARIPVDTVIDMDELPPSFNQPNDYQLIAANCEPTINPLFSPIEEQTDGDTMQSGAGTVLII